MTSVDDVPNEPPVAGNEIDTLLGALERQRSYLAWKCGDLDPEGLRATHGPSSITLGGLLKHLAFVEADYFIWKLLGRDPGPPWNTVDWDADPDWEFRTAPDLTPEELRRRYEDACARSREVVAQASSLDQLSVGTSRRTGRHWDLRWILLHMIEETARHAGHADLLREAVDGKVGQ